jgi:hypothetical protein
MVERERKLKVISILALFLLILRGSLLEEKRKTYLLSPLYTTTYEGNLFNCVERKEK